MNVRKYFMRKLTNLIDEDCSKAQFRRRKVHFRLNDDSLSQNIHFSLNFSPTLHLKEALLSTCAQ